MGATRLGEVRWFKVAVQALAVIAASDAACPSATIAEDVRGHAAFLRRVMAQLVRCGIVAAQEGRAGGYRLARPASEITLGDVFTAVRLAGREEAAEPAGPVCLESVLDEIGAEAEQAAVEVFARHTLAEVMARVNVGASFSSPVLPPAS